MVAVLIAVVIAIFHGHRIVDGFSEPHWEDILFIRFIQEKVPDLLSAFSQGSVWPGLYRPLTTNLYYLVGGEFWQHNIKIYHLINLLMVWSNAFLLYLIACRLQLPKIWALVASLLFASRIAHVEVVLNSVEFQALLSLFFMLFSILSFMVWRERRSNLLLLILSALLLGLAQLSKETALVTPAILFGYIWIYNQGDRKYLHDLILPVGVIAAWMVAFIWVIRPLGGGQETGFEYNFAPISVLTNYAAHLLTFSNVLTSPLNNYVLAPKVAEIATTYSAWAVILCAIGCLLFGLFVRTDGKSVRQELRPLLFGTGYYLVAAAPFAVLGERLYMRYSYNGHVGVAIFCATLSMLLYRSISAWMLPESPAVWQRAVLGGIFGIVIFVI